MKTKTYLKRFISATAVVALIAALAGCPRDRDEEPYGDRPATTDQTETTTMPPMTPPTTGTRETVTQPQAPGTPRLTDAERMRGDVEDGLVQTFREQSERFSGNISQLIEEAQDAGVAGRRDYEEAMNELEDEWRNFQDLLDDQGPDAATDELRESWDRVLSAYDDARAELREYWNN